MTTHIEEFAEHLRVLKERSGRSYGTLAARLHVSTSTLHRYCNGAAVPGDYAPVERFARQCGASAEELVALHQRWLLADALRRRGPDATVTSAAPEVAAEATAAAPARSEEAARPEMADLPEEAAPSEEAELPDVAHAHAPDLEPGGRRIARRPRRRTMIALAAAAVALAAALPLALHTGHDADDNRSLPALPHPTASTPARLSPSVSASGHQHVRTAASASAPAAVRTPTVRPVGGADPPVQVTVLSDNWDTQCDEWFLLPQEPAQVPPPPALQQTNAWGAALGGIPAKDLRLQLTAQGRPGERVVLHALYVKVVSSTAAPKGNGYTPASGCGGGLDPASFDIDLDANVPRASPVAGRVGNGETPVVADFPFKVSVSDTEVLDVDAHTLDHDVSWYLDLVWSSGTRQGTLRIDNGGTPFRTTGLKGRPLYFYDGTRWASTPQ